jgi:hypothetical protein
LDLQERALEIETEKEKDDYKQIGNFLLLQHVQEHPRVEYSSEQRIGHIVPRQNVDGEPSLRQGRQKVHERASKIARRHCKVLVAEAEGNLDAL